MLLSFMGGPEGRQHYGKRIQGIVAYNCLHINHL
jgi:hypothetical protein